MSKYHKFVEEKVLEKEAYEKYENMTEKEILLNILIKLESGNIIADKTRRKVNSLFTWLIVLPLIVVIVAVIIGIISTT